MIERTHGTAHWPVTSMYCGTALYPMSRSISLSISLSLLGPHSSLNSTLSWFGSAGVFSVWVTDVLVVGLYARLIVIIIIIPDFVRSILLSLTTGADFDVYIIIISLLLQ